MNPMKTATKPTIEVATSRFGCLDVDPERVITFANGLIGFEHCKRFVVLHLEEDSPFRWLQSLDDGSVAFAAVDPWVFDSNYAPTISDADAVELSLTTDSEKLVLAVVTIPPDNPKAMTANLLGPVVVNPLTRQAKQVVVLDEEYTTKHPLLTALAQLNRPAA